MNRPDDVSGAVGSTQPPAGDDPFNTIQVPPGQDGISRTGEPPAKEPPWFSPEVLTIFLSIDSKARDPVPEGGWSDDDFVFAEAGVVESG